MNLSQLIVGMFFVGLGFFLIIFAFFQGLIILIYGILVLIVGIVILYNKKEDEIEKRKDLNKKKNKK